MSEPKLRVDGLKKHFTTSSGFVSQLLGREDDDIHAVDGVSLEIRNGETLGIAGESGCGKTTLGKTAIRLLDPTDGKVYFDGDDITEIKGSELNDFRRNAQIIHQDPYKSLNPRFTVYDWVKEPLDIHGIGTAEERENRVYETLEDAGLSPPQAYADEYPPELSGGERQRVGIARALVLDPSFLLADEPASMLDVSIRASILDLFKKLHRERGLTSLYISHDISLLKYMCDRIGIMYLGKLVEIGSAEQIINDPKHPYTQALVASVPVIDPDMNREPIELSGEVPDPVDIQDQCRFYERCSEAMDECRIEEPSMYDTGDEQYARCILYDDTTSADPPTFDSIRSGGERSAGSLD